MKLGEAVGRACRGGEVFELISDLGGGKTAFVRGMAMGMSTTDDVSSPSFTINNTYHGNELTLEHFDFYRLDEAGVIADELREDMYAPGTVVVVEWGDIVHDVLPEDRIKIKITPLHNEIREFVITCPESRAYVLREVIV